MIAAIDGIASPTRSPRPTVRLLELPGIKIGATSESPPPLSVTCALPRRPSDSQRVACSDTCSLRLPPMRLPGLPFNRVSLKLVFVGATQSDRGREGHCRALRPTPLASGSGQCSESKPRELGPESGPRWTRCDNSGFDSNNRKEATGSFLLNSHNLTPTGTLAEVANCSTGKKTLLWLLRSNAN